jgi:hypothetical protein
MPLSLAVMTIALGAGVDISIRGVLGPRSPMASLIKTLVDLGIPSPAQIVGREPLSVIDPLFMMGPRCHLEPYRQRRSGPLATQALEKWPRCRC